MESYLNSTSFNISELMNVDNGKIDEVFYREEGSNDRFSDILDIDFMSWTPKPQGAMVVFLDMTLAILSVVFNLIVITSVKENEDMLSVTFNLVLINLCSSNLLSAVMVKSISIVHNSYAVAANSTESDIAFCILYTFGFRLTWSILPWTVLILSWLTVLPRLRRLEVTQISFTKLVQHCIKSS